ncbi:MAG: methyl-accepting chemotaxis protein [Magnetococcales bacterium]|nr:methyl-accepting chemotaxis protein [Magnetococcales bacterium]MBF0438860.1 methyl-accepting chemotaxis protein [Magnetococcales bacterium]
MLRLKNIRLSTKLFGLLWLIGVIPVLTLWGMGQYQANKVLGLQDTSRLESVSHVVVTNIQRYVTERRTDMETLVQIISERLRQLRVNQETLRDLKKERIETFFDNHLQDVTLLAGNPDFIKRVAAIDWIYRQAGRKNDNKYWRENVEGFAPWIKGGQTSLGVEDLYFVSQMGDVVYSLSHQNELGQNIHHAPLKETGLARVFRQAMEAPAIQDFQPYAPANHAPSAFIGAPVKKDGGIIGAVIIRISRPVLTQLLRAGMDPTSTNGVIVAAMDGLRSDPLPAPLDPLKNPSFQEALKGNIGHSIALGMQKQLLISTWSPLRIKGLSWVIMTEVETSQLLTQQTKENKNGLQKFSDTSGYYDLFLIHPDGTVFYSTARQADHNTNLLTGKYATTNLGQLVGKVLKSKQFGMSDLVPYPPSDNQPAIFMAQPVIENNQVVMVAALQLPPDAITGLMHHSAPSGPIQTFLVGQDQLLRSDAFTDPANPATKTAFIGGSIASIVSPTAISNALEGKTGSQETIHTNGKRLLSVYAPLPLDGFTWVVISQTEPDQINLLSNPNLTPFAIFMGGVLFLVILGFLVIRSDLLHPLMDISTTLNRMASGHFESFVGSTRKDELGVLSRSVATVSDEITQAGQRIQNATEPLAAPIRRLATIAISLSRETTTGLETIHEAKNDLERVNELLKRNAASAKEIVLITKTLFEITKGPLKQAISYFSPRDDSSSLSDPLMEPTANDSTTPAS